jgi:hypothetical protein
MVCSFKEFYRIAGMDTGSWISRAQLPPTPSIDNCERVVRMRARAGTDEECAYCHKLIEAAVELEVDAYLAAGLRTLHFHRICLHLWESLLSQESALPDR